METTSNNPLMKRLLDMHPQRNTLEPLLLALDKLGEAAQSNENANGLFSRRAASSITSAMTLVDHAFGMLISPAAEAAGEYSCLHVATTTR